MNKPLLILFILIGGLTFGQVLIDVTSQYIQNPSFEDYASCPSSNSAYPNSMWIDSVIGWYAPTAGTSDYFNSCNTSANGIPYNNGAGYQESFDGEAYCGFLAYAPDYSQNDRMWSEYIQTQLIQPLELNKRYKFSMRINRANDYNLAVENIGANFSQNSNSNFSVTRPFNIIPTIQNNTGFIIDTLNWILIEGQFQATGNENFLTIGWFGDTITDDFTFFIPPDFDTVTGDSIYITETYYLVDSLKLYEIEEEIIEFDINIITPNNDGVNDIIDFSIFNFTDISFTIINRWGNKVWETTDPNAVWNGKTLSNKMLLEGTYFYFLSAKNIFGKEVIKNGFVQVIR